MKSFMSAALQETTNVNPKAAAECGDCNGGVVRTTGQENVDQVMASAPDNKQPAVQAPAEGENAVVVMQGPLGTVITEALQKTLSKQIISGAPVQLPGSPATESLTTEYVQANGQINNPTELFSRVNKSVGLVPAVDSAPTVVNTFLDAASKVDDVEFIMVNKVDDADANSSRVPQKSLIHIVGVDGVPGGEEVAIESLQVVVTYRKIKR